jgi:hypothetical protein
VKLASVTAPAALLVLVMLCRVLPSRVAGLALVSVDRRVARWIVVVGFAALGLMLAQRTTHLVMHLRGDPDSEAGAWSVVGEIGPPRTSAAELASLRAVVDGRTSPGERIFVAPDQPMLYYVLDRGNPTRFDYLDPVYVTAPVDAQIAADLAKSPPRLVVLADSVFPGSGQTGQQIAPRTYMWIHLHYRPVDAAGPFTVYAAVGQG